MVDTWTLQVRLVDLGHEPIPEARIAISHEPTVFSDGEVLISATKETVVYLDSAGAANVVLPVTTGVFRTVLTLGGRTLALTYLESQAAGGTANLADYISVTQPPSPGTTPSLPSGPHTHDEYLTQPEGDARYSPTGHTHSGYSPTGHTHTGYSLTSHAHDEYLTESEGRGLFALKGEVAPDGFSQADADALYADKDHTHDEYLTQGEGDALFLTQGEGDARYAPTTHAHDEYLTEPEGDARYAPTGHTHDEYLTQGEGDDLFLTQGEGNSLYAPAAHSHDEYLTEAEGDARYVQPADLPEPVTAETLPASLVFFRQPPATTRPTERTDAMVLWVGYDAKPAGFLDGRDLLFGPTTTTTPTDPTPTPDTTAPTAPSNVRVTNATTNSLTFAWDPSTDNVGVVKYQAAFNGGTYTDAMSPVTYTSLIAATDYPFKVRAHDAAGNTTETSFTGRTANAPTAVEHTIFGTSAPPSATANNDGNNIMTATGFYSPAAGWSCVGGRVWVPAGAAVIGKTLTISAIFGQAGEGVPDLSKAAERSGTVTAAQGWNEVRWGTPLPMSTSLPAVYIRSTSGDGYYTTASIASSADYPSPTNSELLLGYSNLRRAAFRQGTGSTQIGAQGVTFYGQDIIAVKA